MRDSGRPTATEPLEIILPADEQTAIHIPALTARTPLSGRPSQSAGRVGIADWGIEQRRGFGMLAAR